LLRGFVGRNWTMNREGVHQWVREGCRFWATTVPLTVRVHRDDVAAVTSATETWGNRSCSGRFFGLAPGDVMIDGEKEQWDARVSTRLEEVERARFTGWRRKEHELRKYTSPSNDCPSLAMWAG
jgi:flagellar biosynthesis/type III secretory pathway protein FliH